MLSMALNSVAHAIGELPAAADELPTDWPVEMVVETAPDLAAAVARARALGGPILIAGSLFLVGEARSQLLGAPTDPMFVTDPAAPRH